MMRRSVATAFCILAAFSSQDLVFFSSQSLWGQQSKSEIKDQTSATPTKGDQIILENKGNNDVRRRLSQGQLKFSFKQTGWKQVIEWYADEAKLDLNMPTVPEGTLTYSSADDMTLLQTLDVLNSFLMREQGYILVLHAKLVFVHDLSRDIPPTMIDSVEVDDLDLLGEYELVQTEYDLKGINAELFAEDIDRFVRPEMGGKKLLLNSSRTLFVRETGGTLRSIQKYLKLAKEAEKRVVKKLELNFVSPQEVLAVAAKLIPLDDENTFESDNKREKLMVVVHQSEDSFILSGTTESIDRFEQIVTLIDKEQKPSPQTLPDSPRIRRYPIATDNEKTLQILRVLLAGQVGLRLDLAEESGDIIAYATDPVHKKIESILASLKSDKPITEVLKLYKYESEEMIEFLNRRFGIVQDSKPNSSAPVFDSSTLSPKDLIVTAKPAVMDSVKAMLLAIDPPLTDADGNFTKNFYHLKKTGPGADAAIAAVKSYFDLLEKPNKIFVYRKNANRPGFKRFELNHQKSLNNRENGPQPSENQDERSKPSPSNQSTPAVPKKVPTQMDKKGTGSIFRLTSAQVESINDSDRSSKQDEAETQMKSGKLESIPGAPITLRATPFGLYIISDDLNALAEIKDILNSFQADLLRPKMPTVIELKHRKAAEMKDRLESFLDLREEPSSGMGNRVDSALGTGRGGLPSVGNLLDSAMGGSQPTVKTTSDFLTGDVKIDFDALKNILVVQANVVDLELIMKYVNLLDVDGAAQKPLLDGDTYTIKLTHRRADEIVELIKKQIPERIKSPAPVQPNQPNPASRLNPLAALAGRGNRSQPAQPKQEEPKITVGADMELNAVLVTGPEFLFKYVENFVKKIDVIDAVKKNSFMILQAKRLSPESIKSALEKMNVVEANGGTNSFSNTLPFGNSQPNRSNSIPRSDMRNSIPRNFNSGNFNRRR